MGKFIWRLENDKGGGVYRDCDLIDFGTFCGDFSKWPAPWGDRHKKLNQSLDDILFSSRYEAIFGFASIGQARAWFDRPELLRSKEWREQVALYAYRREDCRVWDGEKQSMFIPSKDRLKRRVRFGIEELHDKPMRSLVARASAAFACASRLNTPL